MIQKENREPFINVWFGNFYKPAYDDTDYVDEALAHIQSLGFNDVELDSKQSADFAARFAGGEASQYVSMQEYMTAKGANLGLNHCHLALYLNGDNLYPDIRFSPPVHGDSVVNRDGSDGNWYRYWSEKAMDSMVAHVKALLTHFRENHTELVVDGQKKLPVESMFDPIVAPSFDEEGIQRYRNWLKEEYEGDIERLNKRYKTQFDGFNTLAPEDYWFPLKYGEGAMFSAEDRDVQTPRFWLWVDNVKWKRRELQYHFKKMQAKFANIGLDLPLYLSPALTQWGYFLCVDGYIPGVWGSDLWDTSVRGVDFYELASYVDNCFFLTVPLTPTADPDAYAVACQFAMMRSMNNGRDFIGGIYWGRYLYNDLYATLTPCEMIGSMVAAGSQGYYSYGMNGMDDGGLLNRVDEGFQQSLQAGNAWAKKVIPLLGKRLRAKIALLFPSAMSAFESFRVEGNAERRLDLLGWYKALSHRGINVDVIDLSMVEEDALSHYDTLILPANTCYFAEPHPKAEKKLQSWLRQGGRLVHGPLDELARRVTRIEDTPCSQDDMVFGENILLVGSQFSFYNSGETLAYYINHKKPCIVHNLFGKGTVISLGFLFGYNYVSKQLPHIPRKYKIEAFYPLQLTTTDILGAALGSLPTPYCQGRNIECTPFDNGWLVVNHTSTPFTLPKGEGVPHFQHEAGSPEILLPHSSVFIHTTDKKLAPA